MEKISIQSTFTKVSLYAKLTVGGGSAAKPQDGAKPALPAPKAGDDGACGDGSRTMASSRDGDTFSLSIEARAVQVTRSVNIETTEAGSGFGTQGESERLSSGGRVEALMDMLDVLAERRAQGHSGRRHGHAHYPRLGDADDVAAAMLDHWGREHAERGGSKRDFADELRGRLDKWKSAGSESVSRVSVEVREFRTEVSLKVSAGLEDWSADASTPQETGV